MDVSSNIITSGFSKYVSSLIRGSTSKIYFALGTGMTSWDVNGIPTPSLNISSLYNEVYRQEINRDTDIVCVDPDSHEPVDYFTSTIRIKVEFSNNEYYGITREYGLFAVDATSQLKSGTLIAYCDHQKISIPSDTEYVKYIYLNT